MHHQVENLQADIDEFCYRFNHSITKDGIFDNLLNRMVKADPFAYKTTTKLVDKTSLQFVIKS